MAKRLIKIAKELNVGLSTVVDQLKKDGFEIEERPTAKVTDEMYQSLLVAFEKSIAIKEQADKIVIGNRPSKEQEKEEEAKKIVEAQQAAEAEVKAKAEAEAQAKADAEAQKKADTEAKAAAEAKKEAEAKEKAEVKETKAAAPPKEKEVKEAKVAEEKKEVEEKKEDKKEKIVEAAKEEKPAEKETSSNKLSGPKVIGKINLEAPKKKKPAKVAKPKEEGKLTIKKKAGAKEKPVEPKVVEKPVVKAVAKKDDEPLIHATSVPKLKGLKVLGKIDTDKLKPKPKKKDVAKAGAKGAAGAKKKRRRIRRPVGGTANKSTSSSSTSRRRPAGKRAPKRPEVKEISQKEIEEKIKATMARIGGGGNKKKRQKLRREKRDHRREVKEQLIENLDTSKIELTEFISVNELASLLDVSVTQVITTCMNLGVIVSINQRLDAEIIELVAEEFGREVDFISAESQLDEEVTWEDAEEDLLPRSPIVTVMGHVDHGKTSLLDYIRNANVADGEAGGITQHIGSYVVEVGEDKKKITFLDTPGHEAFTAMRARGAKVTDIAIIIIAADDNIMPQTKEAISHAQAAGVPMIFAINKIDKPGASPDRIKNELAEMNLMVEEWGGKYQSQDISAKNGTNIEQLLEKVILETDMLELKANPNRPAIGATLDASLDKGRGYVTKALIQTGTLKIGDPIYAGEHSGKVKAMYDENGKRMKEAGPSQPVLILGLNGAPQAGEYIKVAASEQDAKSISSTRAHLAREQANRASKRISLDEIGRRLALGTFKELNLIIKGDVDGSVEALADSLIKLSVETIQVNVIHKAVGQIIESDVLLASASDAIIIGFQVRPSGTARKLAEKEGVEVKTYSIIYKAIEEIKMAMEGMLEPTKEEKITGQVEIRETYKISKVGTIAGCFVTDGIILRNSFIRLVREGIVVYPIKEGQHGEISSLKRYKDDVKEARAGMECGLSIKNFNDIKVGDVVESYEINEIKQTLD